MNRKLTSAVIGLVLAAASHIVVAQSAPASRVPQSGVPNQAVADAQPPRPTVGAFVAEQPAKPVDSIPVQAPPAAQPGTPVGVSKPAAAPVGSESDEISILMKRAAVLKVKAEIAKYEADIRSAETRGLPSAPGGAPGQFADPSMSPTFAVPGNQPKMPALSAGTAPGKPHLVQIGGADGNYAAVIEINGHTITDAVAGTQLDDDWKVVAVDAKQVKVARGKRVLVLKV